MAFFIAFSAFCSDSFTLLRDMADLIATKTCSGVAIMVMMFSKTIKAFHLFTFFETIFRYMPLFTASITFDKSILIFISISYCLEISNCSFSFLFLLFLLLILFLIFNSLLFLFFKDYILFISFNNIDSFFSFILSLLSVSQIFDNLYSFLLDFLDPLLKIITTYILYGLIAFYFIGMEIVYLRHSLRLINLCILDHKYVVFRLSFRYITFNLFETINIEYVVFCLAFRRFRIIFTPLLNDGSILSL